MLNLTGPCPSLLDLFSDVDQVEQSEMVNTKPLTFVLRNRETVSLLVSKDDLKVRFQAN